MTVELTPAFALSTEHAASGPGGPVLIKRSTGETFGPDDFLSVYLSWGFAPAAVHVARMAQTVNLEDEELELVRAFAG